MHEVHKGVFVGLQWAGHYSEESKLSPLFLLRETFVTFLFGPRTLRYVFPYYLRDKYFLGSWWLVFSEPRPLAKRVNVSSPMHPLCPSCISLCPLCPCIPQRSTCIPIGEAHRTPNPHLRKSPTTPFHFPSTLASNHIYMPFLSITTFQRRTAKVLSLMCMALTISCDPEAVVPDRGATFRAFNTNTQTLPTSIRTMDKRIAMEVSESTDITAMKPQFDVPEGYQVLVGNEVQVSGITVNDFSAPVRYSLKNMETGQVTPWEVTVVPLTCKILIDASHDGGVWWYPQGTNGYNQNESHQGQGFAELLRAKGFEVNELGRGATLTDELFFGHYIVIRATGFFSYSAQELEVYDRLLDRGMNLAFFSDHMKNDPADELADHLGLQLKGTANGIVELEPHELTEGMTYLDYIAGAFLVNDGDPHIEVLGRLRPSDFGDLNSDGVQDPNEPLGPAVMGILNHPTSRIFFMGDTNCFQQQPQPFVDNLIRWMGICR
jgi:hypothetical protein